MTAFCGTIRWLQTYSPWKTLLPDDLLTVSQCMGNFSQSTSLGIQPTAFMFYTHWDRLPSSPGTPPMCCLSLWSVIFTGCSCLCFCLSSHRCGGRPSALSFLVKVVVLLASGKEEGENVCLRFWESPHGRESLCVKISVEGIKFLL